ncbi:membrane protein, putative [Babesia bigemina]|uniref:Membrane protein, putative n=1 Tax=Babesia bigemina TaxID=5866 RepID=A0A061DBI8_BABBI|nr:membrane protein, putative [Babesia bigemina]CDR98076.1 membrane protein, putative [Babesia bigemina]|eukprot:XP_012770262.1 membrane protein, putative [Babesia bigemina]
MKKAALHTPWVLAFTIALSVVDALVLELRVDDGPRKDVISPIYSMPVLATTSDHVDVPTYVFAVAEGGSIEGTVKVVSIEDSPVMVSAGNETNGGITGTLGGYWNSAVQLRQRIKSYKNNRDHYSWLQLIYNLFNWAFGGGRGKDDNNAVSSVSRDPTQTLDNVYIVIISKLKWNLYVKARSEYVMEPAKGSDQFIVSGYFVADMRIPIPAVGQSVNFTYKVKSTDTFVILLFNANESKLIMDGKITLKNPNNDHLSVEMMYYRGILAFWTILYATTGICALLYLIFWLRGTAKGLNYMLALNFVCVAIYLQLDRQLIQLIVDTGTYPNILWTMAHLVKRVHENCLLATLVLLSLGWQIIRENLTPTEFRTVIAVAVFACVNEFFEILVNGTDVARFAVGSVVFITTIIALNINQLIIRASITDESFSEQTGIAYGQLKAYNIFKASIFAGAFKPIIYSMVRTFCFRSSTEQMFIWDEHFMLFMDLMFDYALYCTYFGAFMLISQPPLFKHIFTQCSELH